MPNTTRLKIGADPEFTVLMDGNRVAACEALSEVFKMVGGNETSGYNLTKEGKGQMGVDGCNATGELRPTPNTDPREVGNNLKALFADFFSINHLFSLSTLSLWAPIGGHIHLELPEDLRTRSHINSRKIKKLFKSFISFYLPIMLGEHKTNIKLRLNNYGGISDFRAGEHGTLEVRCPTAEWLTSEKITKATLAYCAVVWHQVVNHPKSIPKEMILNTESQEKAIQDFAIAEMKSITSTLMKDIRKQVRKFELYEEFKAEVEYILRPDLVLKEKQKHNFLIENGWGMSTRKVNPTKKQFTSFKIDESIDSTPVGVGQNLGILDNEDLNTGLIKRLLINKVLEGKGLKNNYFFYGLKHGVNGFLISRMGKAAKEETIEHPIVSNEEEKTKIIIAQSNMASKAMRAFRAGIQIKYSFDFKTNKVKKETKETYAVGVPFELRQKGEYKKVLEKIWAVEKNRPREVEISLTVNKDPEGKNLPDGEATSETSGSEISVDMSSQGSAMGQRNLRTMLANEILEPAGVENICPNCERVDRLRAVETEQEDTMLECLDCGYSYSLSDLIEQSEEGREEREGGEEEEEVEFKWNDVNSVGRGWGRLVDVNTATRGTIHINSTDNTSF